MNTFITGEGISSSQQPLTQMTQPSQIQVEQLETRSTTNENNITMQQTAQHSVTLPPVAAAFTSTNQIPSRESLPSVPTELIFTGEIVQTLTRENQDLRGMNQSLQERNAYLENYVNYLMSFFPPEQEVGQQTEQQVEQQNEQQQVAQTEKQVPVEQAEKQKEQNKEKPIVVIDLADEDNLIHKEVPLVKEKNTGQTRSKAPREIRTPEYVNRNGILFRSLFAKKKKGVASNQSSIIEWAQGLKDTPNSVYKGILYGIIKTYKLTYNAMRLPVTLVEANHYFTEMGLIVNLTEKEIKGAMISNYIKSRKVRNTHHVLALRKYCKFIAYLQDMASAEVIKEVEDDLDTIINKLERLHKKLRDIRDVRNKRDILVSILRAKPYKMAWLIRHLITQDVNK